MTAAHETMNDEESGPFEGPEKLLELWFAPDEGHVVNSNLASKAPAADKLRACPAGAKPWPGLRQVARAVWDDMLDEVHCKVLSVIEGEAMDAYLLSESSMFVWPHKLILKTCGTTTLLLGLPTLLRIASEICGFKGVWRCFYSRKSFLFPERQKGPHKDWAHEVAFLDRLFEDSSAYTVGPTNGDHWLLYLTPPADDVLFPDVLQSSSAMKPSNPRSTTLSSLGESYSSSRPNGMVSPRAVPKTIKTKCSDQTLEILMSRLDPEACASFYHPSGGNYTSPLLPSDAGGDPHALGEALSEQLGIKQLIPQAKLDSFLFSPCGYSSNTVWKDTYSTIHVTPENDYSYASFETNVDFSLLYDDGTNATPGTTAHTLKYQNNMITLIRRVLAIFRPEKMSITLFISEEDEVDNGGFQLEGPSTIPKMNRAKNALMSQSALDNYSRVDRILYDFDGYSLVYVVFEKQT